jgi:hypothetical protein
MRLLMRAARALATMIAPDRVDAATLTAREESAALSFELRHVRDIVNVCAYFG